MPVILIKSFPQPLNFTEVNFAFCGLNSIIVRELVCTEYSFFILFMPKAIWFVNPLICLLEMEGWWVGHKTLPLSTSPDSFPSWEMELPLFANQGQ